MTNKKRGYPFFVIFFLSFLSASERIHPWRNTYLAVIFAQLPASVEKIIITFSERTQKELYDVTRAIIVKKYTPCVCVCNVTNSKEASNLGRDCVFREGAYFHLCHKYGAEAR